MTSMEAPAERFDDGMKRVAQILISPSPASAMQPTQEVRAIPGKSLVGDRYFSGEGTFPRIHKSPTTRSLSSNAKRLRHSPASRASRLQHATRDGTL